MAPRARRDEGLGGEQLGPEPPSPSRAALTLLVGRLTTIKLAYWTALTAFEAALPLADARPYDERLPFSMAAGVVATAAAIVWARTAARAPDRRAGTLSRSVPAIATTFAVTTVVASPASLPLLILERARSLEECAVGACHEVALVFWIAILAAGTVLIPAAFAASLRRADRGAAAT